MRAGVIVGLAVSSVFAMGCSEGQVNYPGYGPYGYAPPPAMGGYGYAPYGLVPGPGSQGVAAVAFAQARIGTPYCWGGTGPGCYDCSGLTSAAWRAAGKAIPRTANAQVQKLPAVPIEAAMPGDILWRPGHVGLYVGQGWVIAATQTGDVVRYQAASGFVRAVRP